MGQCPIWWVLGSLYARFFSRLTVRLTVKFARKHGKSRARHEMRVTKPASASARSCPMSCRAHHHRLRALHLLLPSLVCLCVCLSVCLLSCPLVLYMKRMRTRTHGADGPRPSDALGDHVTARTDGRTDSRRSHKW